MSYTQSVPFDITRNHHKGNSESAAANRKIQKSKELARNYIYKLVDAHGYWGATVDELAVELGVSPNAVSGRVSELKTQGRLLKTDRRRKTRSGCSAAVLITARKVA